MVSAEVNFQQLWEEFHMKLESFVRSRITDSEAAKDIVQDVFVKINSNINTLKDSTKLTSWVFQITRNSIVDYFRKQRFCFEQNEIDITSLNLEENYNEIFFDNTIRFINMLPAKYRDALLLTEYEGLSQLQLAEHLGISYAGAKSRVQRAKAKLKELFLRCCDIESDCFGNILHYEVKPGCCSKTPISKN